MKKVQKFKTLSHVLVSTLLLSFSCTPFPVVQNKPNINIDNKYASKVVTQAMNKPSYKNMTPKESEADRQADWRRRYKDLILKAQNRPRFNGTVNVELNKSLNGSSDQKIDLTEKFNNGFSIQSLPESNIIFQETFSKDKGTFQAVKKFQISDTSKRYTLHVQKSDFFHSNVQININGNNVIHQKNFKSYSNEAEINTLLLNAQNSLRLLIRGNKSAKVTVTLIEGGESGIGLLRRGKLGQPGETHRTRLKNNDVNIFDPNDLNSLGEFTPFLSESTEEEKKVSTILVNGSDKLQYIAGEVIARFETAQKKDEFLELYGGEVLTSIGPAYRIKLDLSNIPIGSFSELLKKHEEQAVESIQSISFSSLPAMQTFAIMLDALLSHPGLAQQVSLNVLYEITPNEVTTGGNETGISAQPFDDWARRDGTGRNIGASWWLSDTRTPEAWQYSKGSGITAAIIDRGFSTDSNSNDIDARRFLINPPAVFSDNSSDTLQAPWQGKVKETFNFHGHYVATSGFAEANNGSGTSGVAPESKVLPIFGGKGGWNAGAAIYAAKDRGAKVINMSADFGDRPFWWAIVFSIFPPTSPFFAISNFLPYWFFEDALVAEPQVPFVLSASNNSEINKPLSYKELYPQKLGADKPGERFDFVIPVGALHPHQNSSASTRVLETDNTSPMFNRVFKLDNIGVENVVTGSSTTIPMDLSRRAGLQVAEFSQLGEELIWAPGRNMYVKDRIGSGVQYFEGTSAAAPFVSGVIALMLSRNPDLTPQEVGRVDKV